MTATLRTQARNAAESARRLGQRWRARSPWRRVALASLGLAIVAGGAVAVAAPRGGTLAEPQGSRPTPAATASTSSAPSTSATPAPAPSGIRPGAIVATTAVDTLDVYANPGDPTPTRTLDRWSYYGQPLTLMGVDATGIGDEEWIEVSLPVQPNGTTGWVRASDVTVTSTDYLVRVYLDERELEYWEGDTLLLTTPVVVGANATPTPPGTFFVTDPLPFANPSGVYGSYALGLSGYSDTLDSFAGGPPQLALHGTNNPSLLGTAASHGCVRIRNDVIDRIAETAARGTPVVIAQSRG